MPGLPPGEGIIREGGTLFAFGLGIRVVANGDGPGSGNSEGVENPVMGRGVLISSFARVFTGDELGRMSKYDIEVELSMGRAVPIGPGVGVGGAKLVHPCQAG